MNAPKPELEVESMPVAKQMREWGCPYSPLDPRGAVWLEGYRAGYKQGGEETSDIFAKAFT